MNFLKYKEDRLTLFYIAIVTSLLLINWQFKTLHPFWYGLQLLMSLTVFVIAHNHNHVPIFKRKIFNRLLNYWLTIFYGFPIFVWTPTHNWNHHKYINRKEDDTLTYRYSEKNNLFTLMTYPTISGIFQQKAIHKHLGFLRRYRITEFWICISQYVVLAAVLGIAFYINWKKALLYLVIPQQVTMFLVLVINYIQHVHADEQSEFNHSRNFTGWVINLFLLNNGYHTAHHKKMDVHWSCLPEVHKTLVDHIDPRLIERSLLWFLFRVYILGFFSTRFQTKSMRLENKMKLSN